MSRKKGTIGLQTLIGSRAHGLTQIAQDYCAADQELSNFFQIFPGPEIYLEVSQLSSSSVLRIHNLQATVLPKML